MKTSQLSLSFFLVILLVALSVIQPQQVKAQSVEPHDLLFYEVETIHQINLERRAQGLAPLRWNRELNQSARGFAQDVVANQPTGYCDHIDSQNRSPGERIRAAGFVRLGAWAENAVCGYTTPAAAVRAWMNSESHRANLLNDRFREIGIGYALSEAGRGYIVADLAVDLSYAPVIIENEAPSTATPQVTLYVYDQATSSGFTGLGPSVEMMISNNPDFSDAHWQPYTADIAWTLGVGEGWKSVYVKTRDALGRTVLVSDSIYLGAELPRTQLTESGASYFDSGFRLERVEAEQWPQIQFSLDWIGDDSDPGFSASPTATTSVTENDAIGGTAVQLLNGGIATLWTGSYLASLPATAYFRIKVSDNSAPHHVVKLRVMSAYGEAGVLLLRGVDFQAPNVYQEFAVPYHLGDEARSVTFRIDRIGSTDVTFDSVILFSAPIPVMAPLQWQSPENYLRSRGVQARFLKEDGSFSPVVDVHPESGVLAYNESDPIVTPTLSVAPTSIWIETPVEQPTPARQVAVECTNCVDGAWQATTESAWLQPIPVDDALLELQVNVEGMLAGIYSGEVVVSAPAENGLAPLAVPVTLVIGDLANLMTEKLYLPTVQR
jgi:uncharacterized protein YkwD